MAKTTDTDYLKAAVSRRESEKQYQENKVQSSGVDTKSADAFIDDITADKPTASKTAEKLHKKAAAVDAADKTADKRDEQRAAQDELKAQEDEQKATGGSVTGTLSAIGDATGKVVTPLHDKIAALPVFGGIGLLVFILIILLFTVVVVNSDGDTRMKQIWYMLNGQAHLSGRVAPPTAITAGSSTTSSNNPIAPINPGAGGTAPPGGQPGAGGTVIGSLLTPAPSTQIGVVPMTDLGHGTTNLGF